jgi:hypothetical protein
MEQPLQISGSSVTYAGGGGAGANSTGGTGGTGGGGDGKANDGTGDAGVVNTGGGGGGGGGDNGGPGGAGGSGIVIIRAPSGTTLAASPGTNTVTTAPCGAQIATFTVSGTNTLTVS